MAVTVPLFLYGRLCDAEMREVVFGPHRARAREAILPDHAAYLATGGPIVVPEPGSAVQGLLFDDLEEDVLRRIEWFLEVQGGLPDGARVMVGGDVAKARFYRAASIPEGAEPWDLEAWTGDLGPGARHAAREIMSYYGRTDARVVRGRLPSLYQRAYSRARAEAMPAPATLRSGTRTETHVDVLEARRPYVNFFALEEHDLRFSKFDGRISAPVNRAGFVGGDAVTVLPYDPASDLVLLVEQFRVGPYLRGDEYPWLLEPIAGRIDFNESPETTARREAEEEANLSLGALHAVSNNYASPGAVTEFVYSYVGIADLSERAEKEIGGLDAEHEDIRSHVVPFSQLMSLIETGEANVGPLVISAFWLALNRDRLRGLA